MRASSLPSDGSSSASVAAAGGGAPFAADEHAIGGKRNREGRCRHGALRPRARLCAIIRTARATRGASAISFFLFKRFASLLLTLLAASVVVFTVLDVLPGNAAEVMLGESATPESVAALSAKLGLDRPALVRYGDWMQGLATGELGTSIAYDTPIAQLVGERLVVTVPLALMAMAADDRARVRARPVRRGAPRPRRRRRRDERRARSASPCRTSGSRSC